MGAVSNDWMITKEDQLKDSGEEELSEKAVITALVNLAGLRSDEVKAGKNRKRFFAVLDGFAAVNRGKGVHYGDYVDLRKGEPELFQIIQTHMEVRRKWVRLDAMVRKLSESRNVTTEDYDRLIETLSDLGVISAMMVDLFITLKIDKRNREDMDA